MEGKFGFKILRVRLQDELQASLMLPVFLFLLFYQASFASRALRSFSTLMSSGYWGRPYLSRLRIMASSE